MVERDQELALLLERWRQAKTGEGQVVLLTGEAGIGKSRIIRAVLNAIAEEDAQRFQCSPYHADSALWPVIQQMSHAAGIVADDPAEAALDKLEALLDRTGGRDAGLLIASLVGLDGAGAMAGRPDTRDAAGGTLAVLVEHLFGLAGALPALVVLEDAHWIDPTTLELIGEFEEIATPAC